jgi:hypothetical protein
MHVSSQNVVKAAYILMTRERKDDDRKTAERRDGTSPMDHTDGSSLVHCISLDNMIDNQYDQVAH